MRLFRRLKPIGTLLSLLALWGLLLQPIHAAMISNSDLLQSQELASAQQIASLLQTEQIRQQLIELGVDPATASLRISQMNPAEIAELNQNLDQLPAGSGLVGALLTVFIVLVITDMLGATDVFPFVKNINKNAQ